MRMCWKLIISVGMIRDYTLVVLALFYLFIFSFLNYMIVELLSMS